MTLEEIMAQAIQGEVESYELYTWATGLVKAEHVKDTLRTLAQEELGHKASLERMLASAAQLRWQTRELLKKPVQDYKIGDHLVVKPLGPESTFQDVLIFASRKEQTSYELYRDLAEQAEDAQAHGVLEAMSKDELRHKNLVERWYEEVIYQDF
jgi:rubrerythrin